MSKQVKKAVIAAAGMGTRFLPQTKAMPKEMLPIIDKPIIQKIVEDAVSAGVEDVIIVTSSKKRAIEDHFDKDPWLVDKLTNDGKEAEAKKVCEIAALANFVYIRQKGDHIGNSVPLMNAAHLLKDEPFFYFYADDYFEGEETAAKQMLNAYEQTGNSVLPLIEVDRMDTGSYGIVEATGDGTVVDVESIIEKPSPEDAPSNLASVHGYLFSPEILKILPDTPLSNRGELEIQWSIGELAKQGKVSGVRIDGEWRDAGNKLGYLTANIKTALNDKDLREPLLKLFQEELDK